MVLRPTDRRGLTEVVAWTATLSSLTLLLIAGLIKTGGLDGMLLGFYGGVISALMARGAQSASERSARDDQARELESAARSWALKAEDAARRAEDAALPPHGDDPEKKF